MVKALIKQTFHNGRSAVSNRFAGMNDILEVQLT